MAASAASSMRLFPVLRGAGVDLQRHPQGHGRERRQLHGLAHHGKRGGDLVVGHFEDQLVMHLQEHAGG